MLVDQFEPGDPRATSGGETRLIRCAHGADADYAAMARRARDAVARARGRVRRRTADRVRRELVRAPRGRLGGGVRAHAGRAGHPGRAARPSTRPRAASRRSRATTSRSCCTSPRPACCAPSGRCRRSRAQARGARRADRARPRAGRTARRVGWTTAPRWRATASCGLRRLARAASSPSLVDAARDAPGAVLLRRRPGLGATPRRGSTTTAPSTAPATSTGSASRWRGTRRARRSTPTPSCRRRPQRDRAARRAATRDERFPALAARAAARLEDLPLRDHARLAVHRRARTRSTPASGSSAAAPGTASSTARRWPSGSPRAWHDGAALPPRFALGEREQGTSLRSAGSN